VGALVVGLLPPILLELLPPLGAPLPADRPVAQAKLIATGHESELVRSVGIARTRRASERVVMSIGPNRLGALNDGDRLEVSAEVQVSTTCVDRGRRCIGRRYHFSPIVTARLVLSGHRKRGVHGRRMSGRKPVVCSQRRPDRNHHCTLTVAGGVASVNGSKTPCAPHRCHVNVVVGAPHRRARRGQRIVLGGDDPRGRVDQDKGRLNVVRLPAQRPPRTRLRVGELLKRSVPVRPRRGTRRRVVYSVAVPELRAGEVIAADGRFATRIGGLRYNAYISSRLILADRPGAVRVTKAVRGFGTREGRFGEHNGFNCTQGPSGYRTPCVTRKAGAVRIRKDAVDAKTGEPLTLYVNLVASVRPRLGGPKRRPRHFHRARLSPAGGLDLVRYGVG
jgi:hypothetical protein